MGSPGKAELGTGGLPSPPTSSLAGFHIQSAVGLKAVASSLGLGHGLPLYMTARAPPWRNPGRDDLLYQNEWRKASRGTGRQQDGSQSFVTESQRECPLTFSIFHHRKKVSRCRPFRSRRSHKCLNIGRQGSLEASQKTAHHETTKNQTSNKPYLKLNIFTCHSLFFPINLLPVHDRIW